MFRRSEQFCSLKEEVQYEEVPSVFALQKCHTVTERVCDTLYDTEMAERDDFKCIEVVNPYCTTKELTVYDKTCRTVTNFDCKAQEYGDVAAGYGEVARGSYGESSQDSYTAGSQARGSYGEGSQDSYTAGSQDPYGSYGSPRNENQYTCKRTPETKCYSTPRTVSQEHCEERKENVCEKVTASVPMPTEKQNCRDEQKKVCKLEKVSQPKYFKNYVYTKHCRPVPKTVCNNADQKSLQPSCVPMSWKECSYYPEEKCEDIPKKHCFKIPYQVKTMQCSQDYGSDRGLNDYDQSRGDGYMALATMGQDYGSDRGHASMESEVTGQY